MKTILLFACAALAVTSVVAQENEAREAGRRPLADVADLEPAVDVSRSEAVPTPQTAAPAAEAPVVAARVGSRGANTLDLGTTSITGNQELPKVLYIVPWKRSDLGDHVGRPVNTLLDEVLEPLDPEVFERHLEYYETLHGVSREE
jgi:hypothetical protein